MPRKDDADIEITLPPLHRGGQRQVAMDPTRFKIIAAGRRWGKTRLGCILCTKVAGEGGVAWWVAPAYPTAKIGWRIIRALGRQVPGIQIREVDKIVQFPNGGWIQVKSADDPDSLRGEGLDFVVIDEVAKIKREAWYEALRPSLTDKRGRALFIGTPKPRGWFKDIFQKGQNGDREFKSFRFRSIDNPYLSSEEIEEARRQLPELVFRQEYLAEFVEGGTLAERFWFEIVDAVPAGAIRVRGWDLAATEKKTAKDDPDFTAGARVSFHDGIYYIEDIRREQGSPGDIRRLLRQTAETDGTECRIRIEEEPGASGKFLSSELIKLLDGFDVDVWSPTGDKVARAMPWLSQAKAGNMKLVRGSWNQDFLDEVENFPLGAHDDQVDALSTAYHALAEEYAGAGEGIGGIYL